MKPEETVYFVIALRLATDHDVESEMAETGGIAHADSKPSRLRAAFDWEQKHNATIQKGSC